MRSTSRFGSTASARVPAGVVRSLRAADIGNRYLQGEQASSSSSSSSTGFTPRTRCSAATPTAAQAMHTADRVGTVEVGKYGDLVVLNADPLADIGRLRRRAPIHRVVKGGARSCRPTWRRRWSDDGRAPLAEPVQPRADPDHRRSADILDERGTLREGEQAALVNIRPEQKIEMAHRLAAAGIRQIQVGYPGLSTLGPRSHQDVKDSGVGAKLEAVVLGYLPNWREQIAARAGQRRRRRRDRLRHVSASPRARLPHVARTGEERSRALIHEAKAAGPHRLVRACGHHPDGARFRARDGPPDRGCGADRL